MRFDRGWQASSHERDVVLAGKAEVKSLQTCSAEPEVFDNRLLTTAVNYAYDPAAPQIMKLLAAVRIHAFGNHAHLPVGALRVGTVPRACCFTGSLLRVALLMAMLTIQNASRAAVQGRDRIQALFPGASIGEYRSTFDYAPSVDVRKARISSVRWKTSRQNER
jgi:hypothetical protein